MKTLRQLLDEMDVPEKRKDDVHWLMRNLQIRNGDHPNFKQAMRLIKEVVRNDHVRVQ